MIDLMPRNRQTDAGQNVRNADLATRQDAPFSAEPTTDTRSPDAQDTPRISVVMPVYNGAETIAESIQSALDQSYAVHEIVVVDDGSSDGTLAVLATLGDKVKVIHQNRKGNASARNRGIREASGDWIAVLDADDIWATDKLEKQVALCSQADIIYTGARNFGETERVAEFTPIESQCGQFDHLGPLLIENYITHSSALARRDALMTVGGYDEALKTACDWDLWLKLANENYRFAGVPEALVYYRWMNGTTSRKNHSLNTRNRLRVLARAVERSGVQRLGFKNLRHAMHSVCRTSAWFAADDQPWFALRWYLFAQVFRPTNYATWRELTGMFLRTVAPSLLPSSGPADSDDRSLSR